MLERHGYTGCYVHEVVRGRLLQALEIRSGDQLLSPIVPLKLSQLAVPNLLNF